MSKVPVRATEVPDYIRITEALDEKFGHENWRWASWAYTRTEHGKVLGSPVAWQDIRVSCRDEGCVGYGKVYIMAAMDAVPDWREERADA